MKRIKITNIIAAVLVIFAVVLFVSPDTKAWVNRGLLKIGLFKADLDREDAASVQTPVETAASASVYFTDGSGNRIDVANQTGKVVFINFWATWCPPCIAEMPSIDKLYGKFKDNGDVIFVMADVDGQYEKSKKFMESKKLGLPVHIPVGNIPNHWLGGAIPTTIILDKKGQIAAKHEGMADYSRPEVADFITKLIEE